MKPRWQAIVVCTIAWSLLAASPRQTKIGCDSNIEQIPADYAAQQRKYNFSVVYTDCRYPHGKAVLVISVTIFPAYNVPGPYAKKIESTVTITFDRQKEEWAGLAQILHFEDGCILNSAKLDPSPMGFRIGDELQGGLYEQARTRKVIDELLHYPFHFLPPDQVGDALCAIIRAGPARPPRKAGRLALRCCPPMGLPLIAAAVTTSRSSRRRPGRRRR